MDQSEQQLQLLGICNKLYNRITKTLTAYALKTVTLGHPMHHNVAKSRNGTTPNQMEQPMTQTHCQGIDPLGTVSSSDNGHKQDGKELPTIQVTEDNINEEKGEKRAEEEAAPLASLATQPKPPKKAVSINDRVEEIDISYKKIKRKKSAEKMTSFELKEEEPKPLKSILKVGSGEKSNSFINRTTDG